MDTKYIHHIHAHFSFFGGEPTSLPLVTTPGKAVFSPPASQFF
jgi:hypothetical protein